MSAVSTRTKKETAGEWRWQQVGVLGTGRLAHARCPNLHATRLSLVGAFQAACLTSFTMLPGDGRLAALPLGQQGLRPHGPYCHYLMGKHAARQLSDPRAVPVWNL